MKDIKCVRWLTCLHDASCPAAMVTGSIVLVRNIFAITVHIRQQGRPKDRIVVWPPCNHSPAGCDPNAIRRH